MPPARAGCPCESSPPCGLTGKSPFAANRPAARGAGSTSAQTHVDVRGFLHTNFSLAKSGEYLALIKPDGVTRTTEFSPAYPEQVTDISYGTRGAFEPLVNETTAVRYLGETGKRIHVVRARHSPGP